MVLIAVGRWPEKTHPSYMTNTSAVLYACCKFMSPVHKNQKYQKNGIRRKTHCAMLWHHQLVRNSFLSLLKNMVSSTHGFFSSHCFAVSTIHCHTEHFCLRSPSL